MGQQAADYARGYAWQNIAAQIIQVYESLLPRVEAETRLSPGIILRPPQLT
jgi:hypothetical protein